MRLAGLFSRPPTGDPADAVPEEAEGPSAPEVPPTPDVPREPRMILAFANQKGGVAKTTSTLNSPSRCRRRPRSVLIVDMDPQGNLTMSQGVNPDQIDRSMFDVLVHRLPIDQVIQEAEVDLAVSSIDLAGAELALSSMIGRERALEKALSLIKERYDFILVDTPPSLGLLTINALVASSGVIVPAQCEYLSLRGLVQLENTLSMIRENLNPDVGIQGSSRRCTTAGLHAREAIDPAGELRRPGLPDPHQEDGPLRRGAGKGKLGAEYDPTGTAAAAYRELAK